MMRFILSFFCYLMMFTLPMIAYSQESKTMTEEQSVLDKFNDYERHFKDNNKFDINAFKSRLINPDPNDTIKEVNFVREDGTQVRQIENKNEYQETLERSDSPYSYWFTYSQDGKLKNKGMRLFGMPINDAYYYNELGQFTGKMRFWPNHTFSIDQLRAKMKKEFDLDILDKNQTDWVECGVLEELEKPYYIVFTPILERPLKTFNMNAYLFDGANGEFIFKKGAVVGDHGCETDLLGEYRKMLLKKSQ